MTLADVVDAVIEAPVVTSFTNVGYQLRRRIDRWRPLDSYALDGRTVVVTGGTSGLGMAAATCFAAAGARVVITGRQRERTEQARDRIGTAGGEVVGLAADMGELDDVRRLAREIRDLTDRVDVLVHNAGALSSTRQTNSAGIEATTASQVVGPFLLTTLLMDRLQAAAPGRVITVASGGMYTAELTVDGLQMSADDYRGSEQYAKAKRAQVTLNETWAERVSPSSAVFHAMHPGWADTPGVREALPLFHRVTRPLLRTAAQGVDTTVWLACDDAALGSSGGFWHDRRQRSIHKLPSTRRSDTADRRRRLRDWVVSASGAEGAPGC